MRKRKYVMSPVEKAVAKQKWKQSLDTAHLQALIGGKWERVVEKVATLFFLVGYAADKDKLPDSPDLRILHGACRSTLDVTRLEELTDLQRGSLEAGLLAVERIKPLLSDDSLMQASVVLTVLREKHDGVYWSDFQEFVK
jgi:hypothetical protein